MSLRHAVLFSFLLAMLAPYYEFVDRPRVRAVAPKTVQERLLELKSIEAITITRGGQRIRYEKTSDGRHYKLVEPAGRFVPEDLMEALAALLMEVRSVEVVSANPGDLAEFGLERPEATITIRSAESPKPITIFFGDDNPTHLAIYARIEGTSKVFLLGKNLEVYQTLMLEWVEGKQGKNA